MTARDLLDRLDKVRKVGAGRWRARCPAHDGRNRNVLSIGEAPDGTVLLHCFHGCTADAIVGALDLDLADLFPPSEWEATGTHSTKPKRPRTDWPALIAACEHDLLLCKILLEYVARRDPINEADAQAGSKAAARVYNAIQKARADVR